MKNSKKKVIILIIVFLFIFIASIVFIYRDHKLYDRSKPDIFEIESASYDTADGISYRYYMVQKIPKNEKKLKQKIDDFIKDNNIPSCYCKPGNTTYVDFFFPSTDFPVYFEQNKNYFIMDDFIDHYYGTNAFAFYKYSGIELQSKSYDDDNIKKITDN